jgi:uncharacterized protein involved in exopolysaccharide biosynthesis
MDLICNIDYLYSTLVELTSGANGKYYLASIVLCNQASKERVLPGFRANEIRIFGKRIRTAPRRGPKNACPAVTPSWWDLPTVRELSVRYEQNRSIPNPAMPSIAAPTAMELQEAGAAKEGVIAAFRLKRPILVVCALFSAVLIGFNFMSPRTWDSTLTILVRNTRPPVEVGPLPTSPQAPPPVDDSEIGTEIQLLSSRDLHEQVVKTLAPALSKAGSLERAKAVKEFETHLKISPLPKTALIRVSYSGSSAANAQAALRTLVDVYLTYHLKLHGGQESLQFFQQEAVRYREALDNARRELAAYEEKTHISALAEDTDLTLRKLSEVRSQFNDTVTEAGETQARISHLSGELGSLQPRVTTQQRAIPNQYSAERLNTMLLELRNRRSSLLTQFRPEDRRVTEVDSEIAQTEAAIATAQSKHETEETTDLNPIRQSFESELAKARIASAAITARRASLAKQAGDYQEKLTGLNRASGSDQQLQLAVKQAEENYTLYQHKMEEARIGSALDLGKIANVTVADGPDLPAAPGSRFGVTQIVGLLLGNFIIFSLFIAAGIRHRVLYSAEEVEALTGMPVLATVPFEIRRQLVAAQIRAVR